MSGLLAGKVWLSNLEREFKPLAAAIADIVDDDASGCAVAFMIGPRGHDESPGNLDISRANKLTILLGQIRLLRCRCEAGLPVTVDALERAEGVARSLLLADAA